MALAEEHDGEGNSGDAMPQQEELTGEALIEHYEATLRQLSSLPEVAMRRTSVEEALVALPPAQAVWLIDQLIRGALWGHQRAIDGSLALAGWLIRAQHRRTSYGLFQQFFEAAHADGRDAVKLLLRAAPPHRALAKGRRLPEVRLPLGRAVSLGERRQLAAGPRRHLLERLLYDPDPLVVRKLLANPHLQEAQVLAVASRRPNVPEILLEIACADPWIARHPVREALVLNPFCETSVSLKLLPTLRIDKLRPLRHAGDLHPALPQAASLLVELREQRTAPWRV